MSLRDDAVACLRAGIAAVEPARLVRAALADPGRLAGAERIYLVAVGKAAASMARAAVEVLGGPGGVEGLRAGVAAASLEAGVVILPAGQEAEAPAGLEVFGGGHPVPNEVGVAGARAVLDLATRAGEGDLLLCLVSGGGSALMTLPPPGIELEAVGETTAALLAAGATIGELNAVRKHLDRVKGGRLAAAAAPARVLALVLSDVVGDPLDVIASGPVSPDPSTFADAREVLERRGVWAAAPGEVRRHLERGLAGEEPESPKPGDRCFDAVEAVIVGSNRMAAAAVAAEAERRGYPPRLVTTELTGEAREAGGQLARRGLELRAAGAAAGPRACLVSAGETTVTVTGRGRGGRNQELVLGAALALAGSSGILVASAGTDGVDGPTDAAGALADGDTVSRAEALGLDPGRALADNDAYPLFAALGDLIVTGPTGTNVMDLQVVLVA